MHHCMQSGRMALSPDPFCGVSILCETDKHCYHGAHVSVCIHAHLTHQMVVFGDDDRDHTKRRQDASFFE